MSVSLFSVKVARRLLFWQLMTLVLLSVFFFLKNTMLGASALMGGLAVWLPNVIFMLFTWRYQSKMPEPRKIAWWFALGEGLKVVLAIALVVLALWLFQVAFLPLIMTYLAVLLVQVAAPALISS